MSTKNNWTPEPWKVSDDVPTRIDRAEIQPGGFMENVVPIMSGGNMLGSEEAIANVARIVACVNACAGIPTSDLLAATACTTDQDRLEWLAHFAEQEKLRLRREARKGKKA